MGSLIVDRLWPTGLLMLTAFAAALLIGTLLGLVAATGRNSWRDAVISLVSLVAYATPGFWLGLMMIVVFAIRLGWLPTSGYDTVGADNEAGTRSGTSAATSSCRRWRSRCSTSRSTPG